MDRRVIVIGRTGQVAHELSRAAWPKGLVVEFRGRDAIDLVRADETRKAILAARPQIVVNAAAFTAVDDAESAQDTAFAVNRDGPAALAEACGVIGAALIHLSTDYVFDGAKQGAYLEDDPVNPLSVYGASKAAGESAVRERMERHVILRTSWIFSSVGRNFVRTMLRLGAERDRLGVVDDQRGCPTAAADIAGAVIAIAAALRHEKEDLFGTFHFCGAGATTWYGFAREIFAGAQARGAKVPGTLAAITTKEYPTPARRPANAVLDCRKIERVYGVVARSWREALAECLDELLGAVSARSVAS